ncbi:hypothetical protein [Phyllobacterium leguminum]|uniref:Uncharacterized protein n=1 Tax=Phyllobacterium leguminum TaxID=314237 RepID=A0A318T3L8_9HYPH|nr:hypothetical protein [Phyllobacterium leguminum]PYE86649.1 hypothetical protein C7477_12114 [Phyllobacterium leguminum]
MDKKPAGNFSAIASVDEEAFEFFNMFDAFGIEDRDRALALVGEATKMGLLHPGFGGRAISEMQPPPLGEPKGALLGHPNIFRSGIVVSLVNVNNQMTVDGASVYFSEGVQHRFALESITLSKNRGMGILHGTIADDVAISVFEPSFISDRQWHGEGSIHEIALYGVPYWLEIGTPPPIEVPDRFSGDGTETKLLYFNKAAMILALKDAPPSFYSILGPVKAVRPYSLEVLGQRITEITVTVARVGEDYEKDVDIKLFVPDSIMSAGTIPDVGHQIQATIRLCSRLWIANVGRN